MVLGSFSPNFSNHSVICGISSRHSSGLTARAFSTCSGDRSRPETSSDSAVGTWPIGVSTAAATGAVGVVRRDPFAMLPFIGYNAGDYVSHWVNTGKQADSTKLPRIFYVNWFRRDEDGGFLWPGFGENSRVLKWVVERLEGTAAAVETAVGHVPTPDSLDVSGLDMTPEQVEAALRVDPEEWKAELPQIQEWFEKFGDQLPAVLWTELDGLRARLGE